MNYYQHHIGDYRRDTMHLSLLEHGCYRALLDMYYLSEDPIPLETQQVFRRLCARTKEEQDAVEMVLKEFFQRTESGWVQARCEVELNDYKRKAGVARSNGKLGGRPKKTQPVISGNPEETKEKANHKPLTINQEPIKTKPAPKAAPRFDPIAIDLPSCIPESDWFRWIHYRRGRKLSNTEATIRGQISRLETWHRQGHSPPQIIADSIANGWQGLFEPKHGGKNGNSNAGIVASFIGADRGQREPALQDAIPGEFRREAERH